MSENIIDILVKYGVVGREDVEAAIALQKEAAAAGKGGGDAFVPENLAGMEKYKNLLNESSEAQEHLREGLHGIAQAGRMAGGAMGEIGHLAHAALNPVALITLGLVGGIEAYYHWLERVEERHHTAILDLAKMNDEQREIIATGGTMIGNWEAGAKATAQLRAEWNGLEEQIRRAMETAKVYDQAAKDALDQRINQRTAELDLITQQITLMETLGRLTQEQADIKRADVEHQQKLDAITADVAKKQADLSAAQADRDHFTQTAGDASADAVEAKRKAAEDAQHAADKSAAILDPDKGNLAEITRLKGVVSAQEKLAAKDDPLNWNMHMDTANQAKDQIKLLQQQMANAQAQLQHQDNVAEAAQKDYETTKGLHDKIQAMDDQITKLQQAVIAAKTAAPQKTADENTRAAMERLQIIVKDSGKNEQQIINEGTAGDQDLRRLQQQGYDAARIQNEGEAAQRAKDTGQGFNQSALDRLQEYKNDLSAQQRLNDLINPQEILRLCRRTPEV